MVWIVCCVVFCDSNLLPSTNGNGFGNFANNGLVPSANMFVPMPVPAVFDAGNESSDAVETDGATGGSAAAAAATSAQQPQQPTFFVPQDAYVPTPAATELEGVQPMSDMTAEPGSGDAQGMGFASMPEAPTYLHPDREIVAGEAAGAGGLAETASSAASAVGPPPPPYFSYATETRADAYRMGESHDDATGSVSYSNDLRGGSGTMHAYATDEYTSGGATEEHGGVSDTLYEQQHYSNEPSSELGVGPPPAVNVDDVSAPTESVQHGQYDTTADARDDDDAVHGVPSVNTSISEDSVAAYARLEKTYAGGIPFANSPYHNRSESGSDFFRSINNATPENDPDSSGQNSAQSPLRSSKPGENGEGVDGWTGDNADLAAPPNGESHTAAMDSTGAYGVAEPDLNPTVSRNSFDDTYYYTSGAADAYSNAMGSANGFVPPPPSTFVIGARDETAEETPATTDHHAPYDGDASAPPPPAPPPTFMVPAGGISVMQPTTAMVPSSFETDAANVDTSAAPSEHYMGGEDTTNDVGALALAAAAATTSTYETVAPQNPADASGEVEDYPQSPPPPPLPVNGYAPPPPLLPPAASFPGADSAAAAPTTSSSDDEGAHLKSWHHMDGTSPIDGIVLEGSAQQEDGAPAGGGGLTLAPPLTPSFTTRIPPMTPTSPVPTTANGSFLSPTPFRTLQTLAAAVESEEDLRSILEMETRIHQYQHELQQQQQRIEAQDSELEAARRHYQDYYYQQYQRDIVAQQSQFEAVIAAERRLREEAMEQVQLLLQQQQQMQERQSALSEAGTAPNDIASTSAAVHPQNDGTRKDADENDDDDAMSDLLCCLGQESRKVLVLSNELQRLGVDVDPLLDGIDEDFSLAAGDDDEEQDDDGSAPHVGDGKHTEEEER